MASRQRSNPNRAGRRRWPLALAIVLAVLAIASWGIGRLLQPERLTALLLERAESELGLHLALDAPADYVLRPDPRLRLSGLQASIPGRPEPFLRIASIDLALPWSALIDGERTVISLILVEPELHLDRLDGWQPPARSTEATPEWPELIDGLTIVDGRILGDGWQIERLGLDLPQLATGSSTRLDLSGRLIGGDTTTLDWRLDLALRPGPGLSLDDLDLRLDATPEIPHLHATGRLSLHPGFDLHLHGRLADWPNRLPRLLAPEPPTAPPSTSTTTPDAATHATLDSQQPNAIDFELNWQGSSAQDADLSLTAVHARARFEGRMQSTTLLDWIASEPRSLLPPIDGSFTADAIEIGGARLEGVRIELSADPITPPTQ